MKWLEKVEKRRNFDTSIPFQFKDNDKYLHFCVFETFEKHVFRDFNSECIYIRSQNLNGITLLLLNKIVNIFIMVFKIFLILKQWLQHKSTFSYFKHYRFLKIKDIKSFTMVLEIYLAIRDITTSSKFKILHIEHLIFYSIMIGKMVFISHWHCTLTIL